MLFLYLGLTIVTFVFKVKDVFIKKFLVSSALLFFL